MAISSGEPMTVTMGGLTFGESPPKHRKIEIEIINGFYLVEVGCKKLIFDSDKKLSDALALYRKDPQEAEKKYTD